MSKEIHDRHDRHWLLAAAALAFLTPAASMSQQILPSLPDEPILVTRHPVRGDGALVVLRTAEDFGISPGGVAVDRAGNVYVATTGAPSLNQGSIIMLPKDGGKPLQILTRLNNPTDIEVSQDQRSLLISTAGGRVIRSYFGVSVRLTSSINTSQAPKLWLHSDQGAKMADFITDGYYHFGNVLAPVQQSDTVSCVINANGRTALVGGLNLDQTPGAGIGGQTLIDISL